MKRRFEGSGEHVVKTKFWMRCSFEVVWDEDTIWR